MSQIAYHQITQQPEVLQSILNIFHLLRNETRFKILLLLLEDEQSVSQLETAIGMSQSAISHQLSLMKKHKVIRSRREGKHQFYTLYDNHVESIIHMAITHAFEEEAIEKKKEE